MQSTQELSLPHLGLLNDVTQLTELTKTAASNRTEMTLNVEQQNPWMSTPTLGSLVSFWAMQITSEIQEGSQLPYLQLLAKTAELVLVGCLDCTWLPHLHAAWDMQADSGPSDNLALALASARACRCRRAEQQQSPEHERPQSAEGQAGQAQSPEPEAMPPPTLLSRSASPAGLCLLWKADAAMQSTQQLSLPHLGLLNDVVQLTEAEEPMERREEAGEEQRQAQSPESARAGERREETGDAEREAHSPELEDAGERREEAAEEQTEECGPCAPLGSLLMCWESETDQDLRCLHCLLMSRDEDVQAADEAGPEPDPGPDSPSDEAYPGLAALVAADDGPSWLDDAVPVPLTWEAGARVDDLRSSLADPDLQSPHRDEADEAYPGLAALLAANDGPSWLDDAVPVPLTWAAGTHVADPDLQSLHRDAAAQCIQRAWRSARARAERAARQCAFWADTEGLIRNESAACIQRAWWAHTQRAVQERWQSLVAAVVAAVRRHQLATAEHNRHLAQERIAQGRGRRCLVSEEASQQQALTGQFTAGLSVLWGCLPGAPPEWLDPQWMARHGQVGFPTLAALRAAVQQAFQKRAAIRIQRGWRACSDRHRVHKTPQVRFADPLVSQIHSAEPQAIGRDVPSSPTPPFQGADPDWLEAIGRLKFPTFAGLRHAVSP